MLHITNHPIMRFDRGKKIVITYNGRAVPAYEGETVAAALYAAGIRIFSRSMKYHRPRGLFCLSGHCSHCLMRVNGEPNVRVCKTFAQENMIIESQNAWPSLKFDIAAIAGRLDFFIRPGFYYRYFIKPRWLFHIWERFLRNAAGTGKIADNPKPPIPVKRKQALPEVLIIGGGIAGMSAALSALRAGADVWMIEKENKPGGRFLYDTREINLPDVSTKRYAFELIDEMSNKLMQSHHFHFLHKTMAFGWYDEGVLAATGPGAFWEFEPHCIIIATGAYETPIVFDNNDLPGVFLSSGIQLLIHRDGVLPGKRALVITTGNEGYIIAKQLHQAGISVVGIADNRIEYFSDTCPEKEYVQENNIAIFSSHEIKSAIGKKQVKGAVLRSIPSSTEQSSEEDIRIACDTICVIGPRFPANDLLFQYGCKGTYILTCPKRFVRKPDTNEHMAISDKVFVVGEANGNSDMRQSILEGKIAGLSAAKYLSPGNLKIEEKIHETETRLQSLQDQD